MTFQVGCQEKLFWRLKCTLRDEKYEKASERVATRATFYSRKKAERKSFKRWLRQI